MEKIKIYGSGKSENHIYYILEKKQKFFEGFRQLLQDIGYDCEQHEVYAFGRPVDEWAEPILSKEENIKKYIDKFYYFKGNQNFVIDIIFGKEKIYLIFNTNKDMQKEISRSIEKFCS